MARPSGSFFRPSAGNGPTECLSRTQRNPIVGCLDTCHSKTGSGSTQFSSVAHLNSGSTSGFAEQRGSAKKNKAQSPVGSTLATSWFAHASQLLIPIN
jgi:hypothetical protein